jgi:hypothetical protein
VSFTAEYRGSEKQLRRDVFPLLREGGAGQIAHPVALTYHDAVFRVSGAMYFDPLDETSIQRNAKRLSDLGLQSKVLRKLCANGTKRYPGFPDGGA